MNEVKPKTFAQDFDIQLDAVEKIFGNHIHFHFTEKDVLDILAKEPHYKEEYKSRIKDIIYRQMNKYQYLFKPTTNTK